MWWMYIGLGIVVASVSSSFSRCWLRARPIPTVRRDPITGIRHYPPFRPLAGDGNLSYHLPAFPAVHLFTSGDFYAWY